MSDFTPIPEPGSPVYPEQVKMIMPGEFAAGGPGSPENTQAEALVQRTQWLRQKAAELEAAIPGSDEWQAILDEIRAELARLQGIEIGALSWQVDHLERIITSIMLTLDAEGKYPNADAVMVETFDVPDQIDQTQVKVTNAFSGDDSIDVEDLSGVVVGANYVLSDGVKQENIRVKSTATSGSQMRVMAENPVVQEYDLNKTYLYRSSVTIINGEAFAGGQTTETAWEPGVSWKGQSVPGGGVDETQEFNASTKATFDYSTGVAWTDSCVRLARVFGVMDTGTRGVNGAGLEWVDKNGNIISSLTTADFNAHPAFNFPEVIVGTNYFRRIPRAYWKRGTGPAGSDAAGKWCMWISDVPLDGFSANPAAFKRSGAWLDQFLWGTYRAFNDGGKPGSQAEKSHWGSVKWQTFKDAAESLGNGHHMVSLFEWHEILGRAVIEKKTFQLVPMANRQNAALCKYRGIEEFAFHGSVVYAEWMDGVRTDANRKFEVWQEAGGSYMSTNATAAVDSKKHSKRFIQNIHSGGFLDFLFLGTSMDVASTAFIPDYSGSYPEHSSRVCHLYLDALNANHGAFSSHFGYLPSEAYAYLGSRLAKW